MFNKFRYFILINCLLTSFSLQGKEVNQKIRIELGADYAIVNNDQPFGLSLGVIPFMTLNNRLNAELKTGVIINKGNTLNRNFVLINIPLMTGIATNTQRRNTFAAAHAGLLLQRRTSTISDITQIGFALNFTAGIKLTQNSGLGINLTPVFYKKTTDFHINPNFIYKF